MHQACKCHFVQFKTSRRGLKGVTEGEVGINAFIMRHSKIVLSTNWAYFRRSAYFRRVCQVMGVLTLKHSWALFGSMALGLMP